METLETRERTNSKMIAHNPNCDGGHCKKSTGETRVYPLGGGGNLILCFDCWVHENKYRHQRKIAYIYQTPHREQDRQEAEKAWPQQNWYQAKIYPEPDEDFNAVS